MKLLLVEDEKITRITLANTLADEGYSVTSCETGEKGLTEIKKQAFDIIVTDLRLPKISGLQILESAKKINPNVKVIVMTAYASVETAVKALKLGAYDYLIKPFSPDKLITTLNHIRNYEKVVTENKRLKQELGIFDGRKIIGSNPQILKLLETVKAVAKNNFTVLIQGESGTGKELIARALHFVCQRANQKFVAVNCSAIPDTLLESELFGYEKGSFTGASKTHIGMFERADKGTIFLDDIDDFPLQLQVKLLRTLQEKVITRVGGSTEIKIDVRIIVATKVNLKKLVNEGKFREDLFYRLNIIPLKIPPLRERKDDIPLLVEHFFIKHGAKEKIALLSEEALQKMIDYDWPGNVRELENFIERIIALSEIPGWEKELFASLTVAKAKTEQTTEILKEKTYPNYNDYIREKETEILNWALGKAKGNVSKAAELLELPRSTFRSKIEKLQILTFDINREKEFKIENGD